MDSTNYANLPAEAVKWLAGGDRCVASSTLFAAMYGVATRCTVQGRAAPSDASDFRLCRLMIESIPDARERLLGLQDIRARGYERVKILSVVKNWDALCAVMDADSPNWRDSKSAPSRKLYEVLHLLNDQAVAKLTSKPDSNATEITGHDEVDVRRGRFLDNELASGGVDTIVLRKTVAHFLNVPVTERDLPGRAALHLVRACIDGIEKLKVAGSDAATKARINKLLETYKGLKDVQAPRGDKASTSVRSYLKGAMTFLWSETHFNRSTPESAAARELFDMMNRKIRAAASQAADAPLTSASSPRRVAAMA
ncbi:hypothetical protein ABIC83_002581 [Roseateles asaccharophilus]|uniref:hypothetical protein n=1 Tax=Roseateles asaccharophilus TaxID=582607 RepID=UPI00383886A4